MRELQRNLSRDELNEIFRLAHGFPENFIISWKEAKKSLIEKYLKLGCKLGDATVAAHIEEFRLHAPVSENRDFLAEVKGLSFRVLSSQEAIEEFLS